MIVGLRVVRGPDWSCGDQDGGEGHVGTVVEVDNEGKSAMVQWDCGGRHKYRCGAEGKYDLRVFDSAPAGLRHLRMMCDWCRLEGLSGMIWKCVRCFDYYLCSQCYMNGRHSLEHEFERINSKQLTKRTRVSLRFTTRKVEVRGIFPGAEVVRGHDWRWGDQDGGLGMVGKVLAIKKWQDKSDRSVAEVEWIAIRKKNMYRVGHIGKVDLKCTVSGSSCGGYYYPDHLPVLGARVMSSQMNEFAAGDAVMVEVDTEFLKMMQEQHGGWNDMMIEYMGSTGVVYRIFDSGDLLVRYPSNAVFVFNPEIVTKANVPYLMLGDVIRVIDDLERLHDLQMAGPQWIDDMAMCLGQTGRITKRTATGNVQVSVNGKRWIFNPNCLVPTPHVELPNNADEEEVDMNSRLQMLQFISNDNGPDGITYAAAAGDASMLEQQLDKFPDEINRRVKGKPALHAACVDGYIDCMKVLIQRGADIELMIYGYVIQKINSSLDVMDKFIRMTVVKDQFTYVLLRKLNRKLDPIDSVCTVVEAARVLLENGVDANSKNVQEATALMISAAVGHYKVVKLLLDHPQTDPHIQDANGSNALQCAVIAQRSKSAGILINGGVDPSLVNFRCSTPMHDIAGFGLLPAMEWIIAGHPKLINLQKAEDGYTPLHIAAANNIRDVANLLAQQKNCELSLKTSSEKLTPLHIAVHEGYSPLVECLVGYGAELNEVTSDGNTVLHLAINRKNMKPLSDMTPQLQKIHSQLSMDNIGFYFEPYVVVACFLVQEGGDLHIKNHQGLSPMHFCSQDIGTVIATFVQNYGRGTFRGSLRIPHAVTAPPPLKMKVRPRVHPQSAVSQPSSAADSAVSMEPTKNINKDIQKGKNVNQESEPKKTTAATADTTTPDEDEADAEEGCFLCDKAADAKLSPCGHTGMCFDCANKAKRCPTCKVPIQNTSRISSAVSIEPTKNINKDIQEGKNVNQESEPKKTTAATADTTTPDEDEADAEEGCLLCDKAADAKLSPCGHTGMCFNCANKAKRCPTCKVPIQNTSRIS